MKLTEEQKNILDHKDNLIVNAISGSGKTLTIIEYAKQFPDLKQLYLVFNKSACEDAKKRFSEEFLNIDIFTSHGLAFRKLRLNYKNILKYGSYNIYGLSKMFDIRLTLASGKLFTHVLNLFEEYCNSSFETIKDVKYLSLIQKSTLAFNFVEKQIKNIESFAEKFWNKMDNQEIDITHSYYLKSYQLSKPNLSEEYDIIYVDEGQDTNPPLLDIFERQTCKKIIIGDSFQQIYSWRGALDSLSKFPEFKKLHLTNSFRFGKNIADLANGILQQKSNTNDIFINGIGGNQKVAGGECHLFRTNIGIFEFLMFNLPTILSKKYKVYFEGGISGYPLLNNNNKKLLDVYYLFKKDYNKITNFFYKNNFDCIEELEEYSKIIEDKETLSIINLVTIYEDKVLELLNTLEPLITKSKSRSEIIISTVHKSKGLEYNKVIIEDDFPLLSELKAKKEKKPNSNSVNEEFNVLYVAVTRAVSGVHFRNDRMKSEILNGA